MAGPKDYGPRSSKHRKASHTQKEAAVPAWMWMLIGLSLGLAIAAAVYIARPTEMQAAKAKVRASDGAEAPQAKIEVPPENKRWLFYDLLENYELVVPPEDSRATKQRARPDPGNYLIQVGSFGKLDDAKRRQAALILMDIPSAIRKVSIDGKETWYRVQVGPVTNQDRIVEILELLDSENIESLMIRAKS